MHYQYQPKHTKETDVARVPLASRSLKSGVAAAAVPAALLPALLATPALAATQIGIDGSTYTEAASGTGSNGGSWSWGGNDSDPLNLNGSNGGAISWQGGDLTINATGDNTVGAGTDSGQGCSVSDNVTAVDNEKDGTTAYTDADGKAASPSDLTITGGGTVSVESAVRVSGGLTVTGGSTLSYVGEDRLGEEGWDEYVAADGGITVEGGSTITTDSDSAYSLFTSGTDISVTGGSKLENVDISTAGGLYVSGSSVDTPWNIVVAVATIDSSDVRCTGELEAVEKGIRLAGSVVRSGEMQPGGKIVYSAAWADWACSPSVPPPSRPPTRPRTLRPRPPSRPSSSPSSPRATPRPRPPTRAMRGFASPWAPSPPAARQPSTCSPRTARSTSCSPPWTRTAWGACPPGSAPDTPWWSPRRRPAPRRRPPQPRRPRP